MAKNEEEERAPGDFLPVFVPLEVTRLPVATSSSSDEDSHTSTAGNVAVASCGTKPIEVVVKGLLGVAGSTATKAP